MALNLSRLDGTNGFRLDGVYGGDFSAGVVAGGGDINGDGIGDLIVEAGSTSYVVFGNSAGFAASLDLSSLNGTNGFRLDGSASSAAGAGDINGDGIEDLIIGALGAGPGGASYVVFGSTTGFAASLDLASLDGTQGFRLDRIDAGDYFSGISVAGAGDVNGDGIDDVIVGAPGAAADGKFRAGESYVVFGSAGFAASLDLSALDGANGFRLDGIDADDLSGRSVAGAGDVNGDGFSDLIIGAFGAAADVAGESYVVFGRSAGFAASLDLAALDGATGFRLDGIDMYDGSGSSVAGAGDINGDGIDDLIVGAPFAEAYGEENVGESYVVFGTSAGFAARVDLSSLDGANGFRLDGIDENNARSGASVAGAGDINGDGIDDLIVGAYSAYGVDPGASYVVFGTSAGFAANLDLSSLDGANGFRLDGIHAGDGMGRSVAGAGDANGDGIDDLIIGTSADESYVVFGSSLLGGGNDEPVAADDTIRVMTLDRADLAADNGSGSDRDPDINDLVVVSIDGAATAVGDRIVLASGIRVTFVGGTEVQFDAPGLAPGASVADTFTYEISDARGGSDVATATVELRQDALGLDDLNGGNGFRIEGIYADGRLGLVAGAGDINGDGIDDMIVSGTSLSYVIFGTSAGFDETFKVSTLNGENGFRLVGDVSSVAGAGDVNADGIDDLIIGDTGAEVDGEPYTGRSYVVFGSVEAFAPSIEFAAPDGDSTVRLEGTGAYDQIGNAVAGAGDINGDGIDDLLISDFPDSRNDGATYVVFGTTSGLPISIELSALNGANGFRLDAGGESLAPAGDVNGDGVDDFIAGDAYANGGECYVVFGSTRDFAPIIETSELDGRNGFRVRGVEVREGVGLSVAGAGDVNGDGLDDLIIGAALTKVGESGYNAGAAYVVFGSSQAYPDIVDLTVLDGANGFRLDGFDAWDHGGRSVASAGDFNGDGLDDLIIGGGGESYVVFGSAAGFAASLDLAALDGSVNGFRVDGVETGDGAGDVNGDGLDDLIFAGGGESYVVFGFRSGGTGVATASVAATSDDAEQRSACARVVSCSQELEIGETAKKLVGLRFTGLEVPDGATVTGAYIEFEAASSDAGASRIAIALEDATSAATFGRCAGRISARPYLEETTSWSPEAWVKGETYRTADLAATISALIGTEGLDPDDALAFRFKGEGEREAAAFESAGAAPKLVINYETGPPSSPVVSVDDLAGANPGFPRFIDASAEPADHPAAYGATEDRSHSGSWDELC